MSTSDNAVELDDDSTTPQTQQTPIGVHIATAISEIIMIFSEFMIGLYLIGYLKSILLPFNHSNHILEILFDTLSNLILLQIVIFTVAFNIGLNTKTVIIRMGLTTNKLYKNLSKMIPIIFILHILGMIVNYVLFTMYNKWLFTLENIMDPFTGNLNYYRIFDLFICSPFREEIVHRGLIFLLLYRHVNPMNYTTSNPNRNSNYNKSNLIAIKSCMIISGIVFGLIHGFNLFGTVYSREYAMMQIFVGCIVSFFYTLRMVITSSLWEPIILHVINNSFSVFIDFSNDDVTDPLVLIPS